tara:strand:- start:3227 stop:4066 length:840 start_codon:yes stop_codon:yes gene_type:complete
MNRIFASAYLSFILIFLPNNSLTQEANTILATVGETKITLGHVIALQSRLTPQYRSLDDETLLKGILDQLIQQAVIAEHVKKESFSRVKFQYENQIRTFLANLYIEILFNKELPEIKIEEFYNSQYGTLNIDNEFNASHILLETETDAIEIRKLLRAGNDFAELAKARSTGPSAPRGGNLGWFSRGMMVPAFEKAVIGLVVGEVSDPIQTQFGWHVIKLLEVRQKPIPSLEDVRSEIESSLKDERLRLEIQKLAAKTKIVRSEISINPSIIRNIELLEK